MDINTIRAWLGHVSLETTNIYAEIDLEMKAKALALCDAAEPGPHRSWKEDKGPHGLPQSHMSAPDYVAATWRNPLLAAGHRVRRCITPTAT